MCTGRFYNMLCAFLLLFPMFNVNANTQVKPDFAYPKTVSSNAEVNLKKALTDGNSPMIVRSLMDYYLAQSAISSDNISAALGKIATVTDGTDDKALKGVLYLLQADIYDGLYNDNRWKYDNREIPLSPLPDNYNLWSGEQFKAKITKLIDSSLCYSQALGEVPLKKYSDVIKSDGETYIYYPTLYDFVANRCISILKGFSRSQRILSWGLLVPHDIYVSSPFPQSDPVVNKILELYASLLRRNEGRTAAELNTDISRISFVNSKVYDDGSDARRKFAALMRSLYEEYATSEYSGDVLCYIHNHGVDVDDKWLYNALSENITKFPNYWRKNCLVNAKNSLAVKSVDLSLPGCVAPGTPVKIDIELKNLNAAKLKIYDVSTSPLYEDYVSFKKSVIKRPVDTLDVKASGEVPFSANTSVEYTFPSVGTYIVVPVIDGVEQDDRAFQKIHVTHFALSTTSMRENVLWVVDAMTGCPIESADITVYKDNYARTKVSSVGETSANGSIILNKDGYVVAEKDGDKYAIPIYNYTRNVDKDDKWHKSAAGFTSLPIYHPGDTVEYVAVSYEYKGKEQRFLRNENVEAVLRDASYNRIDTVSVTTDPYGRASGSFVIPKDCLTGRFCIEVDGVSAIGFEVSDYKLPTFMVELKPVERDYPEKGDVTLRGKVVSYSGFPIADANINVNLSVSQWFRWGWGRNGDVSFSSLSATSGSDGTFEVVIPSNTLVTAPIPDGIFSAEVSAKSISGETQTASTTFTVGTKYCIRASIPEAIAVGKGATPIDVKVVNYMDSVVELPLRYAIKKDSTVVASGIMEPNRREIDFRSVASGKYQLVFELEDASLADESVSTTVIYRSDDKVTPVPGELLWNPVNTVTVKGGDTAKWLYATDCDTYLLITTWTQDTILSQKWLKVPVGMRNMDLSLPKDCDEMNVTVTATGKYRTDTKTLQVKRDVSMKGLKFVTESFRDRLVPGSDETWSFKVIDNSGSGKEAAVIMDMYNTALDALATQSWQLNLRRYYGYRGFNVNSTNISGNNTEYFTTRDRTKYLNCPSLVVPLFDTYDRSFAGAYSLIYSRGIVNEYKSAATFKSKVSSLMTEPTDDAEDEIETEEAPLMAVGSADAGSAAGEESASAGTDHMGQTEQTEQTDFKYRQSEVPLAFFAPTLTTDSDGNLTFGFTVPNANTTWGFRAVAYTDSMLSTNFSADVLANKPVMVQPNLPRFLRTGDKARVLASMMNGTDEPKEVRTIVEIFNPVSGMVIECCEHRDSLEANAAKVVGVTIDVPSDMVFIGYRVKSSSGVFVDGEQALIPILPATTPVIDTYTYYVSPDSLEYAKTLPAVPDDARVTFQFCGNPIWYVVTALPGILSKEPSTANEAAAAIFSAQIAAGIVCDNPVIADAVKVWTRSEKSDGVLTSMLEKNDDLKIMLLSATPWMLDAKSDTERMTRLALIFDKNNIDRVVSSSIALLKKLERNGGGWAWYSAGKKPSEWATENALLMFGRLRTLGYLPKDKTLNEMILRAIGYLDKDVARSYREYPDGDYSVYVSMRDYFRGYTKTGGASGAIKATVNRIFKRWKKSSVFDKAVYTQILNNHGYPSMAKKIVESLREYSEYTPEKGMWWPSLDNMTLWSMGKVGTTAIVLDAFATIEPGCKDIERICQWLILQKEANDWGLSVTTSTVIASILSSSHEWLNAMDKPVITIGGENVAPEETEDMTGYFRVSLNPENISGKRLEINRKDKVPAWGAVFCQYTDSITSVKASSSDAISIEKSAYLLASDDGGRKAEQSDSLHVGDRVRVSLTLHVDRDMDYVAIVDDRPACFEPVEQLPRPIVAEGIYFYLENRDSSTRIFIDHLPKGDYILTYDMWVNNSGDYISGIATVQSQYAPQLSAHSAGSILQVSE